MRFKRGDIVNCSLFGFEFIGVIGGATAMNFGWCHRVKPLSKSFTDISNAIHKEKRSVSGISLTNYLPIIVGNCRCRENSSKCGNCKIKSEIKKEGHDSFVYAMESELTTASDLDRILFSLEEI